MRVHLGESRHQEPVGAVDHKRTLGNRNRVDIADTDYFAIGNDNRFLRQDNVAGHRQDVDIDKDSDGICRKQRRQDEQPGQREYFLDLANHLPSFTKASTS